MKEFLICINFTMSLMCFGGLALSYLTDEHEGLKQSAMIIYAVLATVFVLNTGLVGGL